MYFTDTYQKWRCHAFVFEIKTLQAIIRHRHKNEEKNPRSASVPKRQINHQSATKKNFYFNKINFKRKKNYK